MTPSSFGRGFDSLYVLAASTAAATHGHERIRYIRAAQDAIDRSPGVERLLRDYTDAIFRNTEAILADIQADAT